ncbi:centromere protein J-like isoform X2 [Rhopilema esculentum]|uniref:centromere protein J-like isoform X2 n=1 Tax=Rhopilema esculentum TaxID=499914 RepID=UPI0031DA35CC
MAQSSLREKFKLLRQWQMQQQDVFRKKTQEDAAIFQRTANSVDNSYVQDNDDIIGDDPNRSHGYEELSSVELKENSNPNESRFLQRMTSNSLQQALLLAMNQLGPKNENSNDADSTNHSISKKSMGYNDCDDDKSRNEESNEDDNHVDVVVDDNFNDENDNEGDIGANYFQDNLETSLLKTAIFKPKIDQSFCQDLLSSDIESGQEDEQNEMDGFYPISYSEDNFSEKSAEVDVYTDESQEDLEYPHQNIDSRRIPFEEQPIQSKLGTDDAITFEDLIDRQLKAENEKFKAKPQENLILTSHGSKKTFLKKGEGTARFKTITSLGNQYPLVEKGKKTATVPKSALKLKQDKRAVTQKSTLSSEKEYTDLQEETNEKEIQAVSPESRVQGRAKEKMITSNAFHTGKSNGPLDSKKAFARPQTQDVKTIDSSIEASFQKLIEAKDAEEMIAEEELAEFELLEQVALDTSLSSNASSMLRRVSQKSASAKNITSSPVQKGTDHHVLASRKEKTVQPQRSASFTDISEEDANDTADSDSYSSFGGDANTRTVVPNNESYFEDENDVMKDGFGDDTEWTDQNTDHADEENSTLTEDVTIIEQEKDMFQNLHSSPPTSKLMKAFFPQLKESEASKQMKMPAKEASARRGLSERGNTQVLNEKENSPPLTQHDLLKTKLSELDTEISRFKSENLQLEKLRIDREKELKNLQEEVEEFKKKRSDELERIERFRTEEIQKLKREKKLFEKYQKSVRSAPSKKERDEIEALKLQLAEIQEDIKRRENKWNAAANRFRNRIQELENQNFELKENLALLEQERLQRWFKEDQHKDSLREDAPLKPPEEPKKEMIKQETHVNTKPLQQNVPRKVKSILKRNGSPGSGSESGQPNRKVEGIPRKDISPYMHPDAAKFSEKTLPKLIHDDFKNRLSLTPERQFTSSEISKQNDSQIKHHDGKVERVLSDGSREIEFPNGTKKTIDPVTQNVVVSFFNGDVKQMFPDGRTIYFYAESKTTHTSYKDGTEVFEFSNGQSEKHFTDGRKVITFNDQTVKCIFTNGAEETVFSDGTIQNVDVNGERTISFPNGQREIHTESFKRREYPDGTMKTVYQDGRQETRYSSGRIRVKDQSGNIIMDTGQSS